MNSKIKELAKEAGFVMWANESWKPKDAVVDWSCEYDKELEAFYYLVVGATIQETMFKEHQEFISDIAYQAWRRRESYSIPVTEEGQRKAEERLQEFNKGFVDGIKSAMLVLENLHRENKHQHNFYLFAKNELQQKLKD